MSSWWAPYIESELSQGDIVSEIPVATIVYPATILSKTTIKGGRKAWVPSKTWREEKDGSAHVLARGRLSNAIVISHSCDLDKRERKRRVLVAPVRSIDGLDAGARRSVMEQRRASLFPLPVVPSLGDAYADLRLIMAIDRKLIDGARRLASMTKEGVARLHQQLVGFLVRLDVSGAGAE